MISATFEADMLDVADQMFAEFPTLTVGQLATAMSEARRQLHLSRNELPRPALLAQRTRELLDARVGAA